MKYIKGLDTVRALAIILVILWHWFPRIPIHSIPGFIQHVLIPTGETGVNLFFVLSGFLITSILIKARQDNPDKPAVLKNFIIRRALRIFPIYYLFTIFLVALTNTIPHFGYPLATDNLIYFFTYTTNFLVIKKKEMVIYAHTWSLAIEEQFYLIWPLLILWVRRQWIKYVCISFVAIGVISTFLYHYVMNPGIFDPVFTTCCFDAFGIGGLYAWCQTDPVAMAVFKKYLRMAVPLSIAIYFIWRLVPYIGLEPKLNTFSRTIDSIISIWLIDLVINNRSERVRKHLLENKVLNQIGKVSYGIYLFHTAFPTLFNTFVVDKIVALFPASGIVLHNEVVLFILTCLALYVWCYLSFTFIESKITNLKNKFNYTERSLHKQPEPVKELG